MLTARSSHQAVMMGLGLHLRECMCLELHAMVLQEFDVVERSR